MTSPSYRPFYRSDTDVRTHARGRPDGVFAAEPPPAPSAMVSHPLRRGQPANFLLPTTLAWLAKLPELVRPDNLLEYYPRLVNRLAASWCDPASLALVFNDLLVDRRGGRQGFPPSVQADLTALWRYSQDLPP